MVQRRLLAITGGHRFDVPAFTAMLDAVCAALGWDWVHESQPDAQRWLRPEHAGTWDAIVLHDLPGLTLARGAEPVVMHPDESIRRGVLELLQAGQGIVATHHALAGWPTWDDWATVLGGRFLYAPGQLRGVDVPASGYCMGTYGVDVAAGDHPVCAGVESFELTDERYLCPVFEDEVTPLLTAVPASPDERSSAAVDTSIDTFIDTYHEVRWGEQRRAPAQGGSALLGWARHHAASRIVYLLPGHTASTMQHPMYRRLLANACAWVAGQGTSA